MANTSFDFVALAAQSRVARSVNGGSDGSRCSAKDVAQTPDQTVYRQKPHVGQGVISMPRPASEPDTVVVRMAGTVSLHSSREPLAELFVPMCHSSDSLDRGDERDLESPRSGALQAVVAATSAVCLRFGSGSVDTGSEELREVTFR